jgi:magnesium chelatase family protein
MLSRIYSCAVVGLDGVIVEVEVDYTNGLPGMTMNCPIILFLIQGC